MAEPVAAERPNLPGVQVWPPSSTFTARPEVDEMATLPDGRTRYSLEGPSTGQLVVYIHGTFFAKDTFDAVTELLVLQGYRVLRYDAWGRGYSEWPTRRAPCLDMFLDQLRDLFVFLQLEDEPFDLIGFSLGGILVAHFVKLFHTRVRKVVLMGPAGPAPPEKTQPLTPPPLPSQPVQTMDKERRLAFARAFTGSGRYFSDPESKSWARAKAWIDFQGEESEAFGAFLGFLTSKDFGRTMLASESEYSAVGCATEVLVIWGEEDTVCSYKDLMPWMQRLLPTAVFLGVKGASHADVAVTTCESTARELDAFFRMPSTDAYVADFSARHPPGMTMFARSSHL